MNRKWMLLLATIVTAAMLAAGCSKESETTDQKATGSTSGTQQEQQVSTQVQENTVAVEGEKKQKNNGYSAEPAMQIDANKKYTAILDTTMGTIEIELLPKVAPRTVNSFVFLSKEGYFDDLIFHRVVKDFVLQSGDPLGNGTGGPGYAFADELGSGLSYEPGMVAMANSGPNTNGSQFFICSGEGCRGLNNMPNYSIFGKVIKGMEVVQQINTVEVDYAPSGEMSLPKNPISIKSMMITESE